MALNRCFAAACLALILPGEAAAVTVTDDSGNTITLAAPARRIVSLAPHTTEMLFAAGAGERVVGVVEYSDYPAAAKAITSVGSAMQLDYETVLALKPDLVVAWGSGNSKAMLERIEALGLPLFRSEPKRLEDVAANIETLAVLTATEAPAARAAAAYRQRLHQLRQENGAKPKVRVFYQIWHQPLMTINGRHLISQVIELCGGENIFADLPTLAPQVDIEAVLLANPHVIVSGERSGARQKLLAHWLKWEGLSAVKQGSVYVIHPDLIQRHSPRILEGAALLCDYLDQVRHGMSADTAEGGQQQ